MKYAENLICVYANEVAPLSQLNQTIDLAIKDAAELSAIDISKLELHDQQLAFQWDQKRFQQPRHQEINRQQTATADANWFFLESDNKSASAVLLIHGFLAGPEETRGLGERLHRQGHHVLGVRLKGHGTSPWDLRSRRWQEWAGSVSHGYQIIRAYSEKIHLVGFSTGGLLALHQAASMPDPALKSVTSVSAPIKFRNKNLIFVPLLHHANKLVSWFNSEGLVPFRPNEPENPHINYQHIPIRALYQLQQLIAHLEDSGLPIKVPVKLMQGEEDPVVNPDSVNKLVRLIEGVTPEIVLLKSMRHGVLYHDDDEVQKKISDYLLTMD